ncbi:MAG: beta-N-acetylhexosaminidase [Puniceicoccales bacterium]|nr:beta-N-acetylhexosaminidase [Puniceicoccales bacterium]
MCYFRSTVAGLVGAAAVLIGAMAETQAAGSPLDSRFKLLPTPQKVEALGGGGLPVGEATALGYVFAEGRAQVPPLALVLDALPRVNAAMLATSPFSVSAGVRLRLADLGVPESPEGYILEVTRKGAIITARTQAGLFYGCQTLAQLIEDAREQTANFKGSLVEIPAVRITDFPVIGYRSIQIDTKHHLDTMAYYYNLIDNLARYKVNAIIWEVEDKLRYERRPEVGAPNAISKQEFRALSRYAKERNIEISPLVQGIGHAGFILKHHKELREDPRSDWTFCPSNPKTYELQFDLYRDALEAFPDGKFLHVGGDEVGGLGTCPRCRPLKKSAFELQMIWLKKVCDFVTQAGRTPIFWDDMPLHHGGVYKFIYNMNQRDVPRRWNTENLDKAIGLFPRNCVYMRWNYDLSATNVGSHKVLNWYREKGLRVMGATSASTGGDLFLPRGDSRAKYIQDFSKLAVEHNLEGIFTTNWDDISAHYATVERGYAAQGEFGWNPTARNVKQFIEAHAQREWSFSSVDAVKFITNLERSAPIVETALTKRGRRSAPIDLPDPKNPGGWKKYFGKKLDRMRELDALCKEAASGITYAQAKARRNRFTLEVYAVTNEFFAFAPRILLALEKYDSAAVGSDEKRTALKEVVAISEDFENIRKKVESVYSKTRYANNPPSYMLDQNRHSHIAATTNNSDWFFVSETAFVSKIRDWAKKQ